MKTLTKIAAMLMAFVLMASLLSGCGNNSNAGKTLDENGNVVIRVSIPDGSISRQASDLLSEFLKANSGIVFKEEPIVGDYTTKLITQASAGTAPDLIWVSDINTRLLASKGLLTPLEDYYEQNNFDPSDVYESMLRCGQYGNTQYMIPRDYDHVVTYYNKSIFKEAGVDFPKDGWTWEDFLATASKIPIKNKSVYTRRACEAFLNWGATAPLIFIGIGGTISDKFPAGGSANFNTAGTVKALSTLKKLCDDGIFVNNYYNDIGSFDSGKVAMAFQTRSSCSTYAKSLGAENLGVTTFPVLPEQHLVGSGTSGYAVMKSSNCKEEAAKFLFFVVSEAGQKVFMKSGDCVPVLKSLANDPAWQNSIEGIEWKPFVDSPEYDVLQPSITVASDSASLKYDSAWKNAFSAVLTNIMSPEEAAEFGQTEFERVFGAN